MSDTDRQFYFQWVKHHDLQPISYFTVTQVGSIGEQEWMKKVGRLLLKVSRYSNQHLGGLLSYENGKSTHSHILLLGERYIQPELISKRWKNGVKHHRDVGRLDEDLVRAVNYLGKHPRTTMLRDFCPDPKKCTSPACRLLNGSARK